MNDSYAFQALAKEIARKVNLFYENPENLRKFKEWKEKRIKEVNVCSYNVK